MTTPICESTSNSTDVTAYATRYDIVNLVRKLLLPQGSDGSIFGEVQIGSITVDGFQEGPVCVHRAAHQIASLGDELDPEVYPELYDDDHHLIEEADPDADRRAVQQIVTLLTEAYEL